MPWHCPSCTNSGFMILIIQLWTSWRASLIPVLKKKMEAGTRRQSNKTHWLDKEGISQRSIQETKDLVRTTAQRGEADHRTIIVQILDKSYAMPFAERHEEFLKICGKEFSGLTEHTLILCLVECSHPTKHHHRSEAWWWSIMSTFSFGDFSV